MATITHNIRDYQTAYNYLQKGRDKLSRNLHGRSTVIEAHADYSEIYIRYHSTRIITYYPDGSIKLNGNGYRTSTTKIKINEYTPAHISIGQKAGIWYLFVSNPGDLNVHTSSVYIFADNVVIGADGTVTGAKSKDEEKADLKLIKRINKYTADYVDAFLAGKVNSPTGADCRLCAMHNNAGESLGEASKDTSHLIGHMAEKYYPGHLLNNAMNDKTMPVSQAMRYGLSEVWGDSNGHLYWADMCAQSYVNILRRWIKRQFGLAAR